MNFDFSPIGFAETPYCEKFSIPRQPGLVTADNSSIRLEGKSNREEILRGLEGFSHLWVVFVFHEAMRDDWKPMVRPPRLGGNQKVGVFASRSPFRPNPIGLSVVKIQGIEQRQKHWHIRIEGCDLLDGTPILDIKPYLPYADRIDGAKGGFAETAPATQCTIEYRDKAQDALQKAPQNLKPLLEQVLQQQPQPAYHNPSERDKDRIYGIRLYNFNIRWRFLSHTTQENTIANDIETANQIPDTIQATTQTATGAAIEVLDISAINDGS